MNKLENKVWKRVVGTVKGGFGITDFTKKTITIDKAKHKNIKKYDVPKKDRSLLNTIVHEELHRQNPKLSEKKVIKKTRMKVATMSKKGKSKMYGRYT